jgi:methylmalonyl-CoA mutase
LAPGVHSAVGDRGIIVIAGNPASADELRAGGIEHFIHVRSDVTAMLRLFNKMLGIGEL